MANPNGQRTDLRAAQQLLVPVASLGASSPPLPPLLGAGNGVVALDSSSERWSDGSDFSLSSVSSTAPSVVSFTSSMPYTVPQSPAMTSFDDHSHSTIRAADQTLPSDQTFSLLRYLTHIAPANRSSGRSGSMGAAFASEAPTPQQQSELAEPSTVIAVTTPFVAPASLTQSRESSPVLAAPAPALYSQSSAAVNVDQLSEDLMAFSMKEAPTSSLLSTPTASPSNHHHHLYHSGKPLLDSQPNLDQEEPSPAPSQSSAERAQGNTYQWLNAARYQGNPFFGVGQYTADFASIDTYPGFSDSPSSASASFATAPVAATPLTIDLSPPPPPHQTQSQSHSTIIMPDTVPSLTSGSGTDSDDSTADLPSLANTIVPVFPYGSGHHQQLSATSSLSQIPEDDFVAKSGEAMPLYGVGMPSYLPVYNADTMMVPPLMPPTKVEPFDEYVEEKSEIILPVGLPSNSSVVEAPPSPSGLSDDDATRELHREVFFGESSVTSSPQQQHHLALGSPSLSQSTDSFVVQHVRPPPVALAHPHPPPPRPTMELCSLFMGPTEEPITRPPSFEASSPSQSTAQQQQQEQEHQDANADHGYYDPYQRIREQLRLRQSSHAVPSSTTKPLHPAFWGASTEAAPAPAPAQQPFSMLVPMRARDDPQLALRAAHGFTVPWRNAPPAAPAPSARRRQPICRYGLYEDSSSESSLGGVDDDEGLYQPYVVSGKGKGAVREKVEEKDHVENEQVEPYFVDGSKGKGKETTLESEESFPSKLKQEEREVEFVHAKDIGMDEVTKKPSLSWDPRTWVYSPVQHGGESESMVDSVLDTAERKVSNPTSVRTLDQWVSEVTLYQAKIPSFGDANVNGPEPSMEGSWSTAWFEATKPRPPQQASGSGFAEMRSPTSVVTFAPSAPSSPATTTPTCSSPVSPLPPIRPCRQSRSRSRSRSTSPSPSSSRRPSPSSSPLPTVSFKLPHEDNDDAANRETKPRSSHSVAPSMYPVTPLAPLGDCLNFTADGIRPRPTKANSFGHAPGGSHDYTTRRWNGAPPSVPAFDPAQINNNNIGYNMSTPAWYTGTTPAQAWQTPQTPWMNSNQFPKVSPPTGLGYGYGMPGSAGCLPPPVAPIMGPNLALPPSTSSLPARTTTLPYYSTGIPTYPLPPAQTGPLGTGPFVHTPYILPQVSPPQVQQPTQPPFATPGMGMGFVPVPPLSTFPQVPRWGTTLHTRFCFPDANIAFLVQNVEYRVHRYFLEQHSTFFKELLAPYPAHYTEPITLVTNVRDFDRLLSFFYPADLSEPETKSVEEWTSILSVATNWSFTQLRKRAINMLSTKANAVQRITIARRYNVKELAYAGYEELCMRSQPVPLQDAEELGLKTVLKIWEAQQDLMKVGFCRMHCCKTYVEHTIKKKFDLE